MSYYGLLTVTERLPEEIFEFRFWILDLAPGNHVVRTLSGSINETGLMFIFVFLEKG